MSVLNIQWRRLLLPVTLATAIAAPLAAVTAAEDAGESTDESAKRISQTVERKGLKIEFSAVPALGQFEGERGLMQGDRARIRFRVTDAESGEPVRGLYPGAWLDRSSDGKGGYMSCGKKLSMYLGGKTGMRPLLDMNSFYVLAMNKDATISVIDPAVLVADVPDNFYTQIMLKRPGGDWAKTSNQKRLYVSVPAVDEVAVVDTDKFETLEYIPVGENPLRVRLQPDERYLWVGHGERGKAGGVTVIDTESNEAVAQIDTGAGHHELAFSDDSRWAFVTNRDSGTVSIIDVESLEKVADVSVGSAAMSVAYSPLSDRLYAADGASGKITVIDPATQRVVSRIDADPGVGPLAFDQRGRWGFALNTTGDKVYVIDASGDQVAHEIEVEDGPYKLSFSRNFAYVRSLDTPEVTMIDLSELDGADAPPVHGFDTGDKAPSKAERLSVASYAAASPVEAAMIVTNPADDHLYFYMEGANFPKGSFRSYGHSPRAVEVVDRALTEVEPGVYQSEVRLPLSGEFDVAYVQDAPRILNCFSMQVDENPMLTKRAEYPELEYLVEDRVFSVSEDYTLRFRLRDPNSGKDLEDLDNVRVRYFMAPNRGLREVAAEAVGDGVYEASLAMRRAGTYYVYVAVPSRDTGYQDLPYLTLRGTTKEPSELGMARPASGAE